jgi:hypothetical protein
MNKAWIGAAMLVWVAACRDDVSQNQPSARGEQPGDRAPATRSTSEEETQGAQGGMQPPMPAETAAPRASMPTGLSVAGVASCRPEAQVSEAMDKLVAMADGDGDGQVSRDEAGGLANFLVGGFFFRGDTNGDGTVTPEEGRKVREGFLNQYPAFAGLFREVKSASGQSPFATIAQLVDIEYGKPLSMAEAHTAARSAVDDLYRAADANHNGSLGADELRGLAWKGARDLGHTAFQAADADHDGKLSTQEFQAALKGPAQVAFEVADTNKDGKLTEQEAAAAMGQLVRRVGVQSEVDQAYKP